jgi:hypothetical protein
MRNPTMRLARPEGHFIVPTSFGNAYPIRWVYCRRIDPAAIALYFALSAVISWGTSRYDDMRYGTTRTFHTDAVIGIDDSVTNPTHFVAMNINRQARLFCRFPVAMRDKTRLINGRY